eukprot:9054903-Pyramimonas_sp.AAC.1
MSISLRKGVAHPSPGKIACFATMGHDEAGPKHRIRGAQYSSTCSLSCQRGKPVRLAASSNQWCRTCSKALSRSSSTATATHDISSP